MKQPVLESSKIFTDNDIYFMETMSDKIIINNHYEGVLILKFLRVKFIVKGKMMTKNF